jgi:hypothetical protein
MLLHGGDLFVTEKSGDKGASTIMAFPLVFPSLSLRNLAQRVQSEISADHARPHLLWGGAVAPINEGLVRHPTTAIGVRRTLVQEPPPHIAPDAAATGSVPGVFKILIVDDSAMVRKMALRLLVR